MDNNRIFDADIPETDPDNDALGYSQYAKEIAKTIVTIKSNDGFVIAVTGEWGSGKTTTLNYIEQYLTTKSDDISLNISDAPLILHFNPWLFSGHQDIIFQFFSQIYSEFKKTKIDTKKLQPIFEKLFEFGSLLATISTPAGFFFGSTFSLLKKVAKKDEEKTIDKILKLRHELTSLLKDQNKSVLILIDDVDRLTATEIQELFRALKAVANFPKMIYLLAYDCEYVTEAFENPTIGGLVSRGKGHEYLEKIVQLSLPLPPPKASALDIFMRKEIDAACAPFNELHYDFAHWTWITQGGIDHFVNTPRKVKRLANSLKILYPPIKDDVNVVDFIGLEVLKQHLPSVYQKIRDNPYILLDDRSFFFGYTLTKPEDLQERYYSGLLEGVVNEDKEAAIRIIINLFPNSRQNLDPKFSYYHYENKELRRDRICSSLHHFWRYFRFELSDDDLSTQEILWLLTKNWTSEILLTYLLEQFDKKIPNGHSRLSILLDTLPKFIDQTTSNAFLLILLNSLGTLDDKVFTNSDNSPQMFGPQDNMGRIKVLMKIILEHLPSNQIPETVNGLFRNGTSIPALTAILGMFSAQQGRYGNQISSTPTVSIETVSSIEKIWLEKIRQFAGNKEKFFSAPHIQTILYVWQNIPGCEQEVNMNIQEFIKDDALIIHSISSSRRHDFIQPISPYSLQPFVKTESFKKRVDSILQDSQNITDPEKSSLMDFLTMDPSK